MELVTIECIHCGDFVTFGAPRELDISRRINAAMSLGWRALDLDNVRVVTEYGETDITVEALCVECINGLLEQVGVEQ